VTHQDEKCDEDPGPDEKLKGYHCSSMAKLYASWVSLSCRKQVLLCCSTDLNPAKCGVPCNKNDEKAGQVLEKQSQACLDPRTPLMQYLKHDAVMVANPSF
jgi:hypothetical protein